MKPTLFIADLHLSDHTTDLNALLMQFLQTHENRAQALYILGDLFEAWTGDDDDSETAQQVAQALYQFSRFAPVYFIAGNRDFLLGRDYATRAGMTLLPEQYMITLHGKHILLTHGDEMCTDDRQYLRYRQIIRQPMVRFLLLKLPFRKRKRIAEQLRQASRQRKLQGNSYAISDVTEQGVQTACAGNRALDIIIHGHTHRPNKHQHVANQRVITRYVLPDWRDGKGGYLAVSENGVECVDLPE